MLEQSYSDCLHAYDNLSDSLLPHTHDLGAIAP